jgi:hypothetical protein
MSYCSVAAAGNPPFAVEVNNKKKPSITAPRRCSSADHAAQYHILGLELEAPSLTWHSAGLRSEGVGSLQVSRCPDKGQWRRTRKPIAAPTVRNCARAETGISCVQLSLCSFRTRSSGAADDGNHEEPSGGGAQEFPSYGTRKKERSSKKATMW